MTAFVVTGADLHEAAAWASRLTPLKPPSPLLAGLLLDAGDDLSMTAFDFETRGTVTLAATVKEPGRLLVAGRLLAAVAKTVARDVDVTIEEAGGVAEVRCGRSEWSVPLMPADDYPGMPTCSEPLGTVEPDVLRRALSRVLPAVARDGDIDALKAVRIEPSPGGITIVATDRYRLAAAEVAIAAEDFPECLVPADLIDAAMHTSGADPIGLSATTATFGLTTDTHSIVGRQIAEGYPKWRGMVPEPGEHRAVVDVAELVRALVQAQVMSPNEDAPIQLDFDEDGIEVSASNADRRAKAVIGVHDMGGKPISVKVKAAYLKAALATMESETCAIHFHPRLILMLPCDTDGVAMPGYLHLVMYRVGVRQ